MFPWPKCIHVDTQKFTEILLSVRGTEIEGRTRIQYVDTVRINENVKFRMILKYRTVCCLEKRLIVNIIMKRTYSIEGSINYNVIK